MDKVGKSKLYDHVLENCDIETVYESIKEAISSLSPIIRNRLRGLPPYVLDYSDLIPSNSVEKPFLKPVLICGPTTGEKEILIQRLLSEFPDVFGLPRCHTTKNKGVLQTQHTQRAPELDQGSDAPAVNRLPQAEEILISAVVPQEQNLRLISRRTKSSPQKSFRLLCSRENSWYIMGTCMSIPKCKSDMDSPMKTCKKCSLKVEELSHQDSALPSPAPQYSVHLQRIV